MGILTHIFFLFFICWDLWYLCAPPQWRNVYLVILFSEITNQIVYLKWALAICKTCQFTILQGNINLQFFPFWSTATEYLVHNILCVPHQIQKDVCIWWMIRTCTNIFFQSWTGQLSSLSLVMTQSFQSPFYMKYYFSTVSLNTTTIKWEQLHLKLDRTLTDWLTQQAFMGDIPSQIHPFPITLWRVILIFMLRYCI